MTVVMKSSIFWDVMPYNPSKVNRRFGCLLPAGFLLVLFLYPEDWGENASTSSVNFQWTTWRYMSILEDRTLYILEYNNLRYYEM
jgi:hypothetical protein